MGALPLIGFVPSLVVLIIKWIGFTAAGIMSKSIAAGLMSSAAIANGGGVAAGSFVAICQRIGAVGLINTIKFIPLGFCRIFRWSFN